jgi:hypothetical protein
MNDSYLTHLSISELSYRARYLMENLTTLELNGKIGMGDISREPAHSFIQKFTHVLQELKIRNEEPEKMFLKGASIPKAMLGHEERLRELNKLANTKKPHLIKFGKKEYLEKFSFKVSLASSFNEPSLNAAQMDDEMKAIYTPHPSDISLSKLDGTPIHGVQNIEITYEAKDDYYIFCSSAGFDVRLFGDFESDACLFIYDSDKFSQELYNQVSSHAQVKDHGYKKVSYVDPIRPDKKKVPPVEFHKHIEYLYQNEYRHVFIPYHNGGNPKDLFISMPECSGYTELICL